MDMAAWATGLLRESMRMQVATSGWSRGRRVRIRMSGLRKFLGAGRSVVEVQAGRRKTLLNTEDYRSIHSARVTSDEGDGYTLEGRYAIHCREDELTWNVASYQPAADRRDRYGRTRCPFDPPRGREALKFDL